MSCLVNARRVGAALALVAALGFGGPAAAAEGVPFKGSLEGDVTRTPIDDTRVGVDIDADGTATMLGKFTLEVPHVVDTTTRTATGYFHFVAADGSTLTAEFSGQAGPSDVPGVVRIVEVATITGGTGRFAGATGGFTAVRLYDPAAGTTSGYFEGTISPPGH
ncbi:MAG TPA: hypothetical protein VM533_12020 [Fimbriiglobus sp.]|jgi:hypothetical protein|nr:hypothetical protein [Fimbriiglobus sp.]